MSIDPTGVEPSRARDFVVGAMVGGAANLLFGGVCTWIWLSRGAGFLQEDGFEGWLMAIIVFAFVVSFAALMTARRRPLAWGAVAGGAVAVSVDLGWLALALLQQTT